MSKQQSCLNYEFYFLFQTEAEYNGKHYTEPVSLSNDLIECKEHFYSFKQIDKDKRLFRYSSKCSDLAQWDKELQKVWNDILACYTYYFEQDNSYITDDEIKIFCEQALMGVSLVIMDETLEHHQIKLNTDQGEVIFKPSVDKTPTEKFLLQVEDVVSDDLHSKKCMPKPAHFEEFEIEKQTNSLKNWHIQLSSTQPPCLKPIVDGENQPNPVFSVYGLAHGKLEPVESVDADWADQLQAFLCGGKSKVLVYVILRLMIEKWQFTRLYFDGVQFRKCLDLENEVYKQQKDDSLACYTNKKLAKGLREMATLSTNTQQVLARLDAGLRTLEINRNNLERELRRRREVWQFLEEYPQPKLDWNLTWQHDDHAPLLDRFNMNIRNLQNQVTYIKDAVTYLGGIREHWQLHMDERRLKVSQRLSVLGHFLVFLTVFGEIILITVLGNNANSNNPASSSNSSELQWLIDWLTNIEQSFFIQDIANLVQKPIVYILAILAFLLVPFLSGIFAPLREMLCHFKRKIRNKFLS